MNATVITRGPGVIIEKATASLNCRFVGGGASGTR